MLEQQLYWLAGLLEGEGSFCKPPPSSPNSPFVALEMTDEDVVAKVANLLEISYRQTKNRKPGIWKRSFFLQLRGKRAVVLMKELYPLMGLRRKAQIDRALAAYDPLLRFRKGLPSASELAILNEKHSMRTLAKMFGCSRQTIHNRISLVSQQV